MSSPKPLLSYRIWATQRSGSSMLAKALEQTGVAGRPEELFNIGLDSSMAKNHGVDSYEALRARMWEIGTSENGVFASKYHHSSAYYNLIFTEICELRGIDPEQVANHEVIWQDLFPNNRPIYLTRRNKVRQAVSWWKAIKGEQWHIRPTEKRVELSDDFYEEHYDFAALSHLYHQCVLKESATEAYFQKHEMTPITVVYEDLCRDYSGQLNRILNYLGIDYEVMDAEHAFYTRTADQASEVWVQRFRKDLQKGWSHSDW
ncbi:MAG: Stf0 family sulfotransferase [Bacteroidota bacterium]